MANVNKENEPYLSDIEIDKLNVSQLKDYLRFHNQYVSGKKNELVLRAKGVQKLGLNDLQQEQRNAEVNFEKRKTEKLVTPLGEKLPNPETLKTWSNDLMEFPNFSDGDIYNYFVLKMKTKKQLRSKVYYADRHVHSILYHDINEKCEHCFVKCKVLPSLPSANVKDNPDHNVWLCLSKVTGQVHSAECDCTAGSGEACNHIGALMYALADLTAKKKDGTLASTSKKCVWGQFNNPRKRKLTPKKSSELTFRKYTFDSKLEAVEKKSRKELFINSVDEDRFRLSLEKCNPAAGWLLNFVESKAVEEVPQFLDITFNFKDSVDLTCADVQKTITTKFNELKMSDVDCKTVERLTRGQGKNILWEDERKMRVTASNFGEVMSLKSETPREGPIKRIMYSNITNKYVTWGIKHEPAARRKYEMTMKKTYQDFKVSECGLYVKGDTPYLGASPDGIVTYISQGQMETGVLEIKCPASDRWRNLHPTDCAKDPDFCCVSNPVTGLCHLKTGHKYYYQVQGQMALTGMKWCDFVIWTLGGMSVERIEFNEECWLGMLVKLKDFYQHAVLPELFSRRVQRGLKLY
ncbi:uncharacterized protein LOC123527777 [Mercenaria mercenaria]|uniref:uncharacterized protein LOC123527777 n=1 Tax=Mercenaria mercenaria TaxID=6596 RepID=UPI001E1E16EA|nr:uncharacterized protein LOC123527777 [Mercenaria mercenaria]